VGSAISPSTRNRIIGLAILAACVFCALSASPWQGQVRGTAHSLALPPLRVLASSEAGLRDLLDRLSRLWRATEEVERLRQENRALLEALALREAEVHDATVRLRNFSGFDEFRQTMPVQPTRIVQATVVGADTSPWRHSVIVDRGSADGIAAGTPAVWGMSIVGTVVAVRPHAATVRLLTDSLAGLKVRLARTGDVGVLRGTSDREGLLQLKWLHLHPARLGDLVITSGLDPAIPRGLVAGRVVQAPPAREHLFYNVKVRPLVDLRSLHELLLVVYHAPDVEALREEPAR